MTSLSDELLQDATEILAHFPIGSGYYATSVSVEEAQEMVRALFEAGLLPPAALATEEYGRRDASGAAGALAQPPELIRQQLLEGETVVRRVRHTYASKITPWTEVEPG